MKHNFDRVIDRRGTHCTQWDYVEDRFGVPDLLPFTISDMDIPSPPSILKALESRVKHGIFGYTRWNHREFKGAVRRWFARRGCGHFHLTVDALLAQDGCRRAQSGADEGRGDVLVGVIAEHGAQAGVVVVGQAFELLVGALDVVAQTLDLPAGLAPGLLPGGAGAAE